LDTDGLIKVHYNPNNKIDSIQETQMSYDEFVKRLKFAFFGEV
jgi:hypothetical protein